MDNKRKENSQLKNAKKKKKSKFLIIFICIFMSVIIVAGAILGIVAYVKKKNSVVSYGSYMMTLGEANYFAAVCKYEFMSELAERGITAYDTEDFWASESTEGVTYGELLEARCREYISGLLVANALFDKYSSLKREDKNNIKNFAERILTEQYGGSEDAFNAKAEKYGFDYDDYKNAVKYVYRAAAAQSAVFGSDGSKLASFPEECEDFYEKNYSRVSLLYLRDERMPVTDENGNNTGEYRDITEEEKRERDGYAEILRAAIANKVNGSQDGERISPELFETYYKKSDSTMQLYRAYYFNSSAEETKKYSEEFPEIVEKALSMDFGFAEVECSIGTCFIYKEALDEEGFRNTDNPFFSDFYLIAMYSVYSDMLALYAEDVEFSQNFDNVDIISIPKNYEFVISFS